MDAPSEHEENRVSGASGALHGGLSRPAGGCSAEPVSLSDYAEIFSATAPEAIRAWVDGWAADGLSAAANRGSFERLSLWPRVLRDLRGGTGGIGLLGRDLAAPLLIAPMACQALLDPAGELASARAAALAGVPMVLSTLASIRLEDLARAVPEADLWFQIYAQPRLEDTLDLVRRAAGAGYRALVLTVDAPLSGIRNIEQRAGFALPAAAGCNLRDYAPPAPVTGARSPVFRGLAAAALRWPEAERICRESPLPVLFKGILHPEDAARSITAGAAGVIVSNHGGRVLDTAVPPLAALGGIRARLGTGVPVLLDGGVRRGTDIVKALALGADAVLIGRPVAHALHVGGLAGVAHALTLLQTEFETAMALIGVADPAAITPEHLFREPA